MHFWMALSYITMLGISGLEQVVGGYEMLPSEKVALDLEYI